MSMVMAGGPGAAGGSAGNGPACSDWARDQALSPIGSAGHYQGYLLVELPLPWPPDISEAAELAGVAELAAAAGLRVQAITPPVPGPGAALDQPRRLIYYGPARPGWAGPLGRRERLAGPGEGPLAEVVAELLGTGDGPPSAPGPAVVDLLVCTHGRRDTCCGARGTDLVRALAEGGRVGAGVGAAASPGAQVRLWRTSHTGGHRFAPTALALPTASLWAWADVGLVDQVVGSTGPLSDVVARYRGCATLGPPAHQAVERSVLAEVGWPLLSSWRRSTALDDGWVRLETDEAGTWEARVSEGRHVPQPECRTPPQLASKYSVEWLVEALHQVVPEPR